MSIPKEPRQIMINLMYLVLTAMLALNVSSEILHAFKTINKSILSSNTSITEKNDKIYKSFEEQMGQDATKVRIKPYYEASIQVKSKTEEVMSYIDNWKSRIIERAGGYEMDGEKKEIKNESDLDASTSLLVDNNGGDTLKSKIEDLRNFFLSVVKPGDPKAFAEQLPLTIVDAEVTDNNPKGVWKIGYFQSMPVMAAVTLLSKFQNDIKNTEAMVLNQLNAEAGDMVFKFDAFEAIAVPQNSYVLAGQKVEAKILIAAYNKTVQPSVTRSSGNVTKVENGVALWETTASGVGLQTVKGQVTVDMGNEKVTREYKFEYMVGSTGASMQLDKMNVFYIGVPNPITVSAAGYSVEDISVSIPGADAKMTAKGKYDVMVTTQGTITASILAKTAKGIVPVGNMVVRVKNIPDPIAKVARRTGGYISSAEFKAQAGVIAALENFDFDTRFSVISFDFSYLPKGKDYQGPLPVVGALFSKNAQVNTYQTLQAKPGDKVFIENIKARGPDGRTRTLNTISFTLN